ncbi:MAG: LacI family DNA-binding transcriptional regulator [Eubacterium sp.]|nr:LacI family DNA-binding transcriptional regulator [Eubacterium sp.]
MATIRDIAKMAGVSASTVSRILNNDVSLKTSFETKQKVLETAKKLNYKKNVKQKKAAFKLGIVQWFSPEQETKDSYYFMIRKGIEDFCIKNCIQIVRAFKSDVNYMEQLENVDGLICIGKFSSDEVNRFMKVSNNIVFLDMEIEEYSVTTFSLDFKKAVYDVMEYLERRGHNKIGFLGGKEFVEQGVIFDDDRKKYYLKYCNKHHLDSNKYLKEGTYSVEAGYEMMSELIQEKNIPTAVFAASDHIAIGAMKAIKEKGLRIPEDISLIGFDDVDLCEFTTPTLTTVHAPAYDMGQYGVNYLFAASNLTLSTPIKAKMSCEIVERESCGIIK